MIVQACLNGNRPISFHPALPVTPDAIAEAAIASVAAGAGELHIHPRGPDRQESLAPAVIDTTVAALRAALPGTLIGVSTGAWIHGDDARRLEAIDGWRNPPDYASVNLAENDAPAVIDRLLARGVNVEAGVASLADAERLAGLPTRRRALRILIEVPDRDPEGARSTAVAIAAALANAGVIRPILLHGYDEAMWAMVALAAERRYSTRVGLEDGALLPNGKTARDNTALVATACSPTR
jgi:uncharacterized protein (DUF849 family)